MTHKQFLWIYSVLCACLTFFLGYITHDLTSKPSDQIICPDCVDAIFDKQDIERLNFKLALCTETQFEKRHGISPAFNECQPTDREKIKCNTTLNAKPVSYVCSAESCSWAVRP